MRFPDDRNVRARVRARALSIHDRIYLRVSVHPSDASPLPCPLTCIVPSCVCIHVCLSSDHCPDRSHVIGTVVRPVQPSGVAHEVEHLDVCACGVGLLPKGEHLPGENPKRPASTPNYHPSKSTPNDLQTPRTVTHHRAPQTVTRHRASQTTCKHPKLSPVTEHPKRPANTSNCHPSQSTSNDLLAPQIVTHHRAP